MQLGTADDMMRAFAQRNPLDANYLHLIYDYVDTIVKATGRDRDRVAIEIWRGEVIYLQNLLRAAWHEPF